MVRMEIKKLIYYLICCSFISFSCCILPTVTVAISLSNICSRHITNNSSQSWTVSLESVDKTKTFFSDSLCSDKYSCKIEKGQKVQIDYLADKYGIAGNIVITRTDDKDIHNSFKSASSSYTVCPFISSASDKQKIPVTLNKPARGDLSIDGDGYVF